MNYGLCNRIIPLVILLNFLMTMPMFAQQQIEPLTNSTEDVTRLYGELEIDALIDDLTEAAHNAIRSAAGEAAKAATIAALDNQAKALSEIARLQKQQNETKKNNIRNFIITGLSCFVVGSAVGGCVVYFAGR